jgi:hypothetical protein
MAVVRVGEVDREFELLTDDGVIKIRLTAEVDFCWACAKKAKAKLARTAWDSLKQERGTK